VADEAYRAVFLRVHPTGKMVLSLTTDSDGHEGRYAELVASELGVPALDVKVVAADTDRFGVGHGFNTSPSAGTPAAIASATAKIRDKARLLAGMALDAPPEALTWSNGAWVAGDGGDPAQVKTVEDLALYAHGTGALPPGVEGGLDAQAVYRD
jgi:aerobic carbon-monoxide dehydrogenase large subunit